MLNVLKSIPKASTYLRLTRSIYISTMSTQKAVVHVSKGVAELRNDVPLPKLPSDNWLLVKTKAVALNPTDWKSIERSPAPGAIAGCDYAGIVEEVGKGVTTYQVGDRIAGFVRGGKLMHWPCHGMLANVSQATQQTIQMALLPNMSRPKPASTQKFPKTCLSRMLQPWVSDLPQSPRDCIRSLACHFPQPRYKSLPRL